MGWGRLGRRADELAGTAARERIGVLHMVGKRKCGRGRYAWARGIVGGVLALLSLPTMPVLATDLNLLATLSGNVSGANGGGQSASLEGLSQYLDVNFNRDVTPLLGYRLRFVGAGNESWISTGSTNSSSTNGSIEPIGEVRLAGTRYSLNVGGRLRENYSDSSQAPSVLITENHEYIRGLYTPELLPAFNFQLERAAQTDDRTPHGFDREGTRAVLGATYTFAQKLNLAYTFINETEDDAVTGRRQERRSNVGSANYADSFFRDRLSVDGSYFISRFDTTESFSTVTGSGGITVLPIVLARAFSLTEDNPAVAAASKVPPATYTTLTNSISTSLSITLPLIVDDGGTLNRNQSLAVGLTPGTPATTIRLTVSPRAGDIRDISLQAQGVTFEVFVGASPQVNLTGWTSVPIASVALPTSLDPFFEITIGPTSGNFLKVHVAGDTQQPAFPPLTATAIAALGPPSGGQTGTKISTGNLVQTVIGGVTVHPIEALTLSGNATYSTIQQDPTGRRDNNGTYSVSATGTPHRLLTATANYQNSFTDSNDSQTPTTGQWIGSLTLTSSPLPTLTASLSGSRSENSSGGVTENRIDSISLNTSLKPYRNLNTDVTVSVIDGRSFVDGTKARQYAASVNANAILTTRLTGLFGYTFTENEVTGGVAPLSATTNSTFLQFTYTISRLLNANARWDFTTTGGNYVVTQQYRLNLIPTTKTSIFVTYLRSDESTSQISGNRNSVTVNASWNISRYLDLNAFGSFTRGITGDNVYTFSTTLSFRL